MSPGNKILHLFVYPAPGSNPESLSYLIADQVFRLFNESWINALTGKTTYYVFIVCEKYSFSRIILKSLFLCIIFTPDVSAEISFSTKSLLISQKNTEASRNYLFNRFRTQTYFDLDKNYSIEIDYELFPALTDSASDISTISIKNYKTRIYRITDLNLLLPGTPDSSATSRNWHVEQNLDRIFIRYQAGNLEFILGRQAVAFGAATISPTDVFTPVSFKALDQEYRPGVDAVRITGGFGDTTEIEGGIVAGKNFLPGNNGAYLRSHFLHGKTDLTPMAAVFKKNQLLGLTLQTELVKVGFVFDGAVVLQRKSAAEKNSDGSEQWAQWTIGLNLQWSQQLFTMLEMHFNSMGTDNPGSYLNNASSVIYQEYPVTLLGRDYLLPSFNYQISPLWSLNSSAYFNLNDSSSQTISGLEWNNSENWLFSGSFILASGKNSAKPTQKKSEFGDTPNSFQLMLKHYL
ncbi:MAG: hypothetical protein NZ867_03205 [SAR324 cluster bacterium]|nr:hypothetical protein [SAR324 cluster bacterium]